jgi:hypothetical protein
MAEMGKYLYGVLGSNDRRSFESDELAYTIPYKDISALVADSEIIDFSHTFRDTLAKQLVKHQRVIEGVMSEYSIIPMRLGFFASDEDEVMEILAHGYNMIKEIFGKVRDTIETDVVALWNDLGSVLKEIGEEKEIKEIKERLLVSGQKITLEDQMRIGYMVKKILDEKRKAYASQIQSALEALSYGSKAHELMDDSMVLNTAFLVSKCNEDNFEKKVDELNDGLSDRLHFKYISPLPPYSFYTLEVKKICHEEIEQAKNILGLDDISSREKIKKAYQKSAFLSHPDRNPDNPSIEKEFNNITKAYKTLVEYCVACEQAGGGISGNTLLVKVKE